MAAALDAAHAAGVIHRDFKPSNVMLARTAEGTRAVVTDFGLARSLRPGEAPNTQTSRVMGTFDYMAPELFTGRAASVASDVYALGMVAREMVTGARQATETAPDPVWNRAIQRALDPGPERRFASAGDFVRALRGEVPRATLVRRRAIGSVAAVLALIGRLVGWRGW